MRREKLSNDTVTAAMILAAGEGTRLRPYTLTMPKPMLPVAGRPTLEWTILWLRHYGVREVGTISSASRAFAVSTACDMTKRQDILV
jgi:dTDP-glucose pyrophosphorylase